MVGVRKAPEGGCVELDVGAELARDTEARVDDELVAVGNGGLRLARLRRCGRSYSWLGSGLHRHGWRRCRTSGGARR